MTRTPSRPDLNRRSTAIARAEERLKISAPDFIIEAAEKLTAQKIEVKGLPADYFYRLFEDEIVDVCIRAAINARWTVCA